MSPEQSNASGPGAAALVAVADLRQRRRDRLGGGRAGDDRELGHGGGVDGAAGDGGGHAGLLGGREPVEVGPVRGGALLDLGLLRPQLRGAGLGGGGGLVGCCLGLPGGVLRVAAWATTALVRVAMTSSVVIRWTSTSADPLVRKAAMRDCVLPV